MKYSFNKSLLIVPTLLALTFNAFGVTSVYALKSREATRLSLPDAPIVTAPPAYTNDTTPTIKGKAAEGSLVNVWYLDDSGALIPICQNVRVDDDDEREDKSNDDEDEFENWSCNSSKILPEREIELIVNATDKAGHTSADTSYFFTIDVTAPETQIDAQPANPSNSANASFTFSSTDTTATFECRLDNGGFSACTSPKDYTGLADGSHTFEVRAKDAAGNPDPTPASYTWIVSAGTSGAEIQVLGGATDIPDGTGTVDFGTTPPGTPVTMTFTVTNLGTADLTLTEPISVPAGFSLVSSFGSLTLAPAASTSFQVRLDAVTAASYSGEVSFGNNDADENPFNFTINGMVTNQINLTLIASGAATVIPGDQYTYTLNYTTVTSLSNAQVSLTLPGHTTFVSSDKSCTVAGGIATCDLGSLGAGSGSFNFIVLVDKLKKVGTPLTLDTTSYSISATGVTTVNGSTTVTADVVTAFADVPAGHWALDYVQSIWAAGITTGCLSSPLSYCPDEDMLRSEMAVYIERGIHGGSYIPPVVPLTFADTAGSYQYWIEALKADGITGGCGGANFCPNANITRAQMAIFLLRAKHGGAYIPPAPTGTVWLDVPVTYWAAGWAEQLGNEGISVGCGEGKFCPDDPVSRAQMAVLVQRTFSLPLPTP